MIVELDRDTTLYPDGNIVEVRWNLFCTSSMTDFQSEVAPGSSTYAFRWVHNTAYW